MKTKAVIKYILKDLLIVVLVIVYAIAMDSLLGYSCLFRVIFDIECPFCGMTRAHIEALHFNIKDAFNHHSLFFLGLPYLYIIFHGELFKGKAEKFYYPIIITMTALFLIRYVIRFFI